MVTARITDMCDVEAVEMLKEAIACYCEEALSPEDELEVRTYAEAGVLTHNKGLVLAMPDGSEFQITVVKSA